MILALLLACSDTPEAVPFNTFADVHQPLLEINAGNLAPRGRRVQVFVHPELEGVCRALPELQAKLDGIRSRGSTASTTTARPATTAIVSCTDSRAWPT